jgi:hypothetical protein
MQVDLNRFRGGLLGLGAGDAVGTTAAIRRQLAGVCYGESGILTKRLDSLFMRAEITEFADKLSGIENQ